MRLSCATINSTWLSNLYHTFRRVFVLNSETVYTSLACPYLVLRWLQQSRSIVIPYHPVSTWGIPVLLQGKYKQRMEFLL